MHKVNCKSILNRHYLTNLTQKTEGAGFCVHGQAGTQLYKKDPTNYIIKCYHRDTKSIKKC